ncbi:MAG: hypothetical protein J3K34DRAFT_516635, partial [Monoraphidium minutum]
MEGAADEDDDLAMELEALRYTYPEIQIDERPQAAAPAESIELRDARGLGDGRRASAAARLEAEAAEHAGGPCLGQLVELCLDILTEYNCPEGPCAICLGDMAPAAGDADTDCDCCGDSDRGGGGGAAPPALSRLPCYHAFHTACFARWWGHEQLSYVQRERQLAAQTGATAAAALAQKLLPAKDARGSFLLACPVCRAAFDQSDLDPLLPPHLAAASRAAARGAGGGGGGGEKGAAAGGAPAGGGGGGGGGALGLGGAALAELRALQRARAGRFEAQRARGGIIEEANFSIAGWDAAAAAAAAAEAAARAAPAAAAGGGGAAGGGRG